MRSEARRFDMQALQRSGFLVVALISMMPASADAQGVQISCDQYARDYSNIVAPRSGGAVVANPMTQYPGSNQRSSQSPQARENTEWRQMVPNQDAYRMAYDRCTANRR